MNEIEERLSKRLEKLENKQKRIDRNEQFVLNLDIPTKCKLCIHTRVITERSGNSYSVKHRVLCTLHKREVSFSLANRCKVKLEIPDE